MVLFGFDMNRLGIEQTIATQFASEGLEIVKSIKNQGFINLVNSLATGVSQSGGVWIFSGSNNTFDKYTRVISVEDVYRDINNDIVTTGGALDNQTKKISSTVTWNISGSRSNSVVLVTYLTNWRALIGSPTPTPTPTIIPSTCNEYAIMQGYASGVCRKSVSQCTSNGEINIIGGDAYCNQPPNDTCCVLVGPTPTSTPTSIPTPTYTPTPTPTFTPTPTPVITSCDQFCQTTYLLPGNCVKSNKCTGTKSSNRYECTSPNVCCCQ